jgi:threonine dehydratase
MAELNENTLKQKINDFGKTHKIVNVQYSTTPYIYPYMNSFSSKVYHSVLIKYENK